MKMSVKMQNEKKCSIIKIYNKYYIIQQIAKINSLFQLLHKASLRNLKKKYSEVCSKKFITPMAISNLESCII